MKVAMIINSLEVGGAEISLENLSHSLSKEISIEIISLSTVGHIGLRMRDRGFTVHECGFDRGFSFINNFINLIKLIRNMQPDVVHTWMYHSNLLGGIAAKFAGVHKILWSIHNFNLDKGILKPSTRILIKTSAFFSYWVPSAIICCSQNSLETHKKLYYQKSKLFFLPNGVNVENFKFSDIGRKKVRDELRLNTKDIVIGSVGRFDIQKNQLGFIRALAKNKKISRNFIYVLIGRNNDKDNYELINAINESGLKSQIKLLGERDDIKDILSALDIFVLPSLGEAFPISLCEAMLCGLPSIATDVGDIKYILGGIIEPLQIRDLDSIPFKIDNIASKSTIERKALGNKLKQRIIENFSIDMIANKHLNIYYSISKNLPNV